MIIELAIPLKISEICVYGAAKSKLQDDCIINKIVTDSRELCAGDLFVALHGKNHNGNEFLLDARTLGAISVSEYGAGADLECDNTEVFLLRLSNEYLTRFSSLKYRIAVTGSVGKTTAKEFCSALLSEKYAVHKTQGNFNNRIGLAITLLSTPKNAEIIVGELGMNAKGEISELSKTLLPTHAIITNIGNAHIGILGSRKMIAEAKLEILDGMTGGLIIAPNGEPLLSNRSFVYYSLDDPTSDRYLLKCGSSINYYENQCFKFSAETSLEAEHHIKALLIAISLSSELGLSDAEIKSGTKKIKASILRQKEYKVGNIYIIDDTYSASPDAVIAEMTQLSKKKQPFSVLLGDMLELGDLTEDEHRKVGKKAYELGARHLYTFGKFATNIAIGAKESGMNNNNIFINENIADPNLSAILIKNNSLNGEKILIKASHAIHAERIIEHLKDEK